LSYLFQTLFLLILTCASAAELYVVDISTPEFDRWMYPYNASVGSRENATTFSSIGGGYDTFDDRDGQVLVSFATADFVPDHQGANRYSIVEASFEITLSSSDLLFDSTSDSWQSYSPENGVEDSDLGRPFELFGAAFRGGFDGWTFGETGPFPFGAVRRERNVYPVSFTPNFGAIDASNNVLDEFDPQPFAVGIAQGISDGEPIPSETVIHFDIDTQDPDIQCYLRHAVDQGLVSLVLTSLHEAQQPGVRETRGLLQPAFHMKESWLVYFELAEAARLSIIVEIVGGAIPEDLDGDGFVNIGDVLTALSDWGYCICCQSDLDGDGEVGINDLLSIIGAWS
jgi:hypothetical protein